MTYTAYNPDGSVWYTVGEDVFRTWGEQARKILADLSNSDWRLVEAKKRFHRAVEQDLIAQAREAGFTSKLKLKDFLDDS